MHQTFSDFRSPGKMQPEIHVKRNIVLNLYLAIFQIIMLINNIAAYFIVIDFGTKY